MRNDALRWWRKSWRRPDGAGRHVALPFYAPALRPAGGASRVRASIHLCHFYADMDAHECYSVQIRSIIMAKERDMPDVVNLAHKFSLIGDHWKPRIAGDINDSYLKLVKVKGEFVWHHHETEDELFLVVKGRLLMRFRDGDVTINEGEFIIVPHGVEHCPVAEKEVELILLEPKTTVNTGSAGGERTAPAEWI
jgi:mannose-6-phosphate isomerase-like protein (cupin superfamily)